MSVRSRQAAAEATSPSSAITNVVQLGAVEGLGPGPWPDVIELARAFIVVVTSSSILAEEQHPVGHLVDAGDVDVTVAVAVVQGRAAPRARGEQDRVVAHQPGAEVAVEIEVGAEAARHEVEQLVAVQVADLDRDRKAPGGVARRGQEAA